VIFLATSQWFIRMDARGLRERALEAIGRVQWIPAWGAERISGMIAHRPDWCISRQRSWGVPIPAVYCTSCGEAALTTALATRAADVFEQHGADAWYERPAEEFVPADMSCAACGGTSFERERDILDVWFDSGSSHEGVLALRPELSWPADVYIEGSDQYRGWFHSSLLVGIGTRGAAPYRTVITHGFVVDEDGRKMSKSRGTGVEPQEIIAKSGAEILRLWAAMVDFRDEVRLGPEILARVVEAYRKVRNTLRILVANLYDFDPSVDAIPVPHLQEVDRFALARYAEAALRIRDAYRDCDFQGISHRLTGLLTVDLSAFYIDVSKDRLYTLGAASRARRSAQTAMYTIADGLARLTAPILPVTMDELWGHLPGERAASVHLTRFPDRDALAELVDPDLLARWDWLLQVREEVNRVIETARQQKAIGNALAARVVVRANGIESHSRLASQDLEMLFMTSSAPLLGPGDALEEDGWLARGRIHDLDIAVAKAEGVKCQRCWRYVGVTSEEPGREGLCGRCVDAISTPPGSRNAAGAGARSGVVE
jgi:isoleucyl-tRNA synthetase